MPNIQDFRSLEEYRQWLRMFRLFRDYPTEQIRTKGMEHLPRIMKKVGGTYYERLTNDWADALNDPDARHMRNIALDMTQYGIDMRQINPFQGIMSQEDLMSVIKDSRNEQRRVLSSSSGIIDHH